MCLLLGAIKMLWGRQLNMQHNPVQDQQQLVELLTALMESCGLGAGQGLPFEASKVHPLTTLLWPAVPHVLRAAGTVSA